MKCWTIREEMEITSWLRDVFDLLDSPPGPWLRDISVRIIVNSLHKCFHCLLARILHVPFAFSFGSRGLVSFVSKPDLRSSSRTTQHLRRPGLSMTTAISLAFEPAVQDHWSLCYFLAPSRLHIYSQQVNDLIDVRLSSEYRTLDTSWWQDPVLFRPRITMIMAW